MTSVVRNARTDYHLDTRIRRRHVPLYSQQRRLRHLKCLVARNLLPKFPDDFIPTGVYFSLHLKPSLPAFYTSEVSEDCVNPAWRMFEASAFPDDVNTSGGSVCGKIWFAVDPERVLCTLECFIFFSGLVFFGEQIPKEGKKFAPNTILFGTPEGFYGSPDCLHTLNEEAEYSVRESIPADPSLVRVSYSVNTVYRIQTVQRAIKQTQATVRKTRAKIQEQLLVKANIQERLSEKELLLMKLAALRLESNVHLENIKQLESKRHKLEEELKECAKEQLQREEELSRDRTWLMERRHSYHESCETLLKTTAQLSLRRKQLISELSVIYPISIFPDKNGFSISGIHLPQSEEFKGHDDTMISVALGYVTHLVMMICNFLNVPLSYPLNHFGSRSSILDLIFDRIPDREFPLYARSKDKMHFCYGVYLLNKNIAQLRQYCGLGTTDLRLTLHNLQDLIKQRLSIKSDVPHSYLNTPSPLERLVQIKSDPSQVVVAQNGSANIRLEISRMAPDPIDIMANLEREMAAVSSAPLCQNSVKTSEMTMSCSLDKGLNELRRISMSRDILKESIHSAAQHSSVPNLSAPASIPVNSLNEQFDSSVCGANSAHNSDDDILDS